MTELNKHHRNPAALGIRLPEAIRPGQSWHHVPGQQ